MNASLLEHVSRLTDPRIERHKRHALIDIVVLTICAVVSGAEGWEDIAAFGHEKLRWLRRFIALKNGVPSHDCIAYVMSRLSPKSFQKCFADWARGVMEHTYGRNRQGSWSPGNSALPDYRGSRHLCLNLRRQESSTLSIKKKQLKAAWNDRFRYKVLFG